MRTRWIAAVLLALFSATTAVAEDGVIVVCPAYIYVTPTQLPAGWTVPIIANQPFKDAGIKDGKIWCGYAEPNPKNAESGVISKPVPAGMACTVNAASPRQFDCLPQAPRTPGIRIMAKPSTLAKPK